MQKFDIVFILNMDGKMIHKNKYKNLMQLNFHITIIYSM